MEVGRYNPKYFEIDKNVPSNTFHQFNFLTEKEKEKLKQDFELEMTKEER